MKSGSEVQMFGRYALIADGNTGRTGVSSLPRSYLRGTERCSRLSCKVYVFNWHAIRALWGWLLSEECLAGEDVLGGNKFFWDN